jgi:hypothetical protein
MRRAGQDAKDRPGVCFIWKAMLRGNIPASPEGGSRKYDLDYNALTL